MKVQRELPHDEVLAPGSPLCAGCGALAALRLLLNSLGRQVVVVNAAGCLTLMAVPTPRCAAPGCTPPWARPPRAPREFETLSMC